MVAWIISCGFLWGSLVLIISLESCLGVVLDPRLRGVSSTHGHVSVSHSNFRVEGVQAVGVM